MNSLLNMKALHLSIQANLAQGYKGCAEGAKNNLRRPRGQSIASSFCIAHGMNHNNQQLFEIRLPMFANVPGSIDMPHQFGMSTMHSH